MPVVGERAHTGALRQGVLAEAGIEGAVDNLVRRRDVAVIVPPQAPGDSTLLSQDRTRYSGRIPMVKGGGSRPSVAPRTPARAPRTTRAHIWCAFPLET
jgi:hypothetical protein